MTHAIVTRATDQAGKDSATVVLML